jgi:hypothetical protein
MQLADMHISLGNDSLAQIIIDNLQADSSLSNYCTIQNIIINLHLQDKTFFDIKSDSTAYHNVEAIADDSLHAGYSRARNILALVDKKLYPEIIGFTPPEYRKRRDEVMFASGQKLLRNYPNPFSTLTVVEVQAAEDLIDPQLVINDIAGRTISIFKLHSGLNEVTLQAYGLKAGVYFYSLVSMNRKISTEKMICTQ